MYLLFIFIFSSVEALEKFFQLQKNNARFAAIDEDSTMQSMSYAYIQRGF